MIIEVDCMIKFIELTVIQLLNLFQLMMMMMMNIPKQWKEKNKENHLKKH